MIPGLGRSEVVIIYPDWWISQAFGDGYNLQAGDACLGLGLACRRLENCVKSSHGESWGW